MTGILPCREMMVLTGWSGKEEEGALTTIEGRHDICLMKEHCTHLDETSEDKSDCILQEDHLQELEYDFVRVSEIASDKSGEAAYLNNERGYLKWTNGLNGMTMILVRLNDVKSQKNVGESFVR